MSLLVEEHQRAMGEDPAGGFAPDSRFHAEYNEESHLVIHGLGQGRPQEFDP
jgi:hypothetical protein